MTMPPLQITLPFEDWLEICEGNLEDSAYIRAKAKLKREIHKQTDKALDNKEGKQ